MKDVLERFRTEKKFSSKGAVCLALFVTARVREEKMQFPLKWQPFETASGGQIQGLNGSKIQEILLRHGVAAKVAKEAGRTNRNNIALLQAYIACLNELHKDLGKAFSLDEAETFWVEAVRELASKDTESGEELGSPLSIVFTGPPGTGKTRAAIILADLILKGSKVPDALEDLEGKKFPQKFAKDDPPNFFRTQFHPSFSYEDFLEGLRPISIANGEKSDISYRVVPGPLKVSAMLARANLEAGKFGIPIIARYVDGDWRFGDELESLYRFEEREGEFRHNGLVVRHTGVSIKKGFTYVRDSFVDGHLYQLEWFYKETVEPEQFVLFIDELNRGNPARIFGESLSLIEDSKRMGGEEQASIILPYSHTKLMMPRNLHLICAMNLSDRSLATIDQALRRRFRFVYLKPRHDLLMAASYTTLVGDISENAEVAHDLVAGLLAAINIALERADVSQDNLLGHSYGFKVLKKIHQGPPSRSKEEIKDETIERLQRLWADELHPLLRDILGDHRLSKFCVELATALAKGGTLEVGDLKDILKHSSPKSLPIRSIA